MSHFSGSRRLRPLVVALPMALAGTLAGAAEPYELTEITVEESAAASAFEGTAVDSDELRWRRAISSDSATLLKDVPGVSLYGAGGVSSLPVIHGLADDRLRIKLDGMDLIASCPNHMNPVLSYIDPTQVGSIRVYAGVAPVSVGGDSIGGAIVAGVLLGTFQGVASGYLDRLVGGGSRELVVAATLVLTILIRPHGLFGREDIQRI